MLAASLKTIVSQYGFPVISHLPWSPGITESELATSKTEIASFLVGQNVVITEKMDGENITMYNDAMHSSGPHAEMREESYDWIQQYLNDNGWKVPIRIRVCGEHMYARHNISYDNLESFFLVHSVWHDKVCFGWDETKRVAGDMGMVMVPTLWEGKIENYKHLIDLTEEFITDDMEGLVVRLTRPLTHSFKSRKRPIMGMYKYIRAAELPDREHWTTGPLFPNNLAEVPKHYDIDIHNIL